MHAVLCILNTGAELSIVNKLLITREWNYRIYWRKMSSLRTATQQLLHLDGRILLHVRFDALYTWVWIDIVSNLAVDM